MRRFSSRGRRCDVKFPLESALKGNLHALTLVLNTWALHGEELPKWTPIKLNCWEVLWIQIKGRRVSEDRDTAEWGCNSVRTSEGARPTKLVGLPSLFTAVLPKRLYKTHTPCIHYHLRYKTHRSHHGLIKRTRQTPSLLTLSPFPLFLHWRSLLPFCFLFLFPSSPFLGLCSR